MKGRLLFVSICFICYSCIPLRIAPKIDDYKVVRGKKFKKDLPERNMYVFEDPKAAEEFYAFVNTGFQLDDINVYDDVPFVIDGEQYFFAFYEVEIPDKTFNLFPILLNEVLNVALDVDEETEYEGDEHLTRRANWYIAIEVYSDHENDCLAVNSLSRTRVLKYLRALKKEYLSTNNYNELVFKD